MTLIWKSFFSLGIAAFAASCAPTGGGGSSLGRDEWGHRAGPKGFKTVIIDAGHGGTDSGAVSSLTGQREKDLTLDMVKRIRTELGGGFHIVKMRGNDTFVDLDDRVNGANLLGDAILVSMHFNSGPSNVRGPETYYWRVDSHGLATRLQRAMASVSPAENSNRGLVRRRLRLTRNPDIPCVLVEEDTSAAPPRATSSRTPPIAKSSPAPSPEPSKPSPPMATPAPAPCPARSMNPRAGRPIKASDFPAARSAIAEFAPLRRILHLAELIRLAQSVPARHGGAVTRDLSAKPAWQDKDLGLPLPDSPHACSVCLPTWAAVVGYEEGRDKVGQADADGLPEVFQASDGGALV